MAVKGPNGRDPSLDVYDVPPSVEKGLPLSNHHTVSSRGMLGLDGDTGLGCDGVCAAGGDPRLHPGGGRRDLTTGASSAPDSLCDRRGNRVLLRASAFLSIQGPLMGL